MAIVISGVNNNDKITATDGVIDSISGFNLAGIITASSFTGDLTGDVTGNISGNNGVFGDFVNVGSNIQIGQAGILTATTFVGNLTGNVNATSNLLLQIGGSEKFRVASSGQLGIGGANYGTSGQVLTSGGSSSAATWSTISAPAITSIDSDGTARVLTSDGDGTATAHSEVKIETVSGNKRVSINRGTGSTEVPLLVRRTDASGIVAEFSNSGGYGVYIGQNGATGEGYIRTATGQPLVFTTNSGSGITNERVRIASDGNVSVGNIHAVKKIHISTTGNQKILIDPNYNNNSGGSSNSEANAGSTVESILIRTSFGDNAASQTNAGHKWGIKFQGYNGNDFTQASAKTAAVYATSEDDGAGYNRQVGLTFHTSPFDTAHREVMRINANGIVTKPYTYAFLVGTSGASKAANWSKVTGLAPASAQCTGVSDGTNWSNSTQRFTAPVTGVYYFYVGGWATPSSNGTRYAYSFRHTNGNNLTYIGGGDYCTGDSPMAGWSRVIKLSAGEWVELWMYSAISATLGGGHHFFWGGYQLG